MTQVLEATLLRLRIERCPSASERRSVSSCPTGYSATALQHVRAVLSGVFATAVSWELLESNPVKAVETPTAARPDLEVPRVEQAMSLLAVAQGTPWAIPILLAITSGCRRSEILGLAWRLMAKAGLDPATRPHDLRHSLATTLLEEGVDITVVSSILGQSSTSFTADIYRHLTEGLSEQAAALERRFGL